MTIGYDLPSSLFELFNITNINYVFLGNEIWNCLQKIPILLHLMPHNPANNDKTIFDVILYLQKQDENFSISMNMR